MPRNSLRPYAKPRRLLVYSRKRGTTPAAKSGWDKAAVLVQAVGAFVIFISLASLFISVRQFNDQQETNAAQLVNQQNQATLDEYLDDMSTLVLQYHLADPNSGAAVRAIAVARTLTAVRDLDGDRKGTLVRFLFEADLINWPQPVLDLFHANLDGTNFTNAGLDQVYLSHLGLTSADFAGSSLLGAYLKGSTLIQSNLQGADLACYSHVICTNLSGAYLMRADLISANLSGADLMGACLDGANLSGANLAGVKLQKAMYNTRPILVINGQGMLVTDMPTVWPKGFDPKAAGATPNYC